MMCLASLTWAWFTFDVQSSGTVLRAAEFNSTVYVTPSDPSQTTYQNVVFTPGNYHVLVKQTGSAKTGYCLVTIDGKTYFAGELQKKLNADTQTAYCALEFDFEIATAPAIVSIDPVWGMYFGSYDVLPHDDDEPIEGSLTVVPPITVEKTAADTDETTSPEETTLTPSETVAPEEESTDTTAEPTETAEPVETEAETTAEPTETTEPEVTESEETEAETISEPSETIEPEETEQQEPSAEADFE